MRKSLILAALLFILTLTSTVAAQDDEPFCDRLNDADCADFVEATDSFGMIDAANFLLDVKIELDAGRDEASITVVGEGSFDGLSALFGNDLTSVDQFADLLSGFDASLSLTISASPRSALPGVPVPLTLEMALVEGVGYLNFDGFSEIIPGARRMSGWGGTDLSQMLTMVGLLAGDQLDEMFEERAEQQEARDDLRTTLDPEAEFSSIDRDGDVFRIEIDLAEMLADPDLNDVFVEQLVGQQGMTRRDAEDTLTGLEILYPDMFLAIEYGYDFDAEQLTSLRMIAEFDSEMPDLLPSLTFDAIITYSDINQATVSAPRSAEVVALMRALAIFE